MCVLSPLHTCKCINNTNCECLSVSFLSFHAHVALRVFTIEGFTVHTFVPYIETGHVNFPIRNIYLNRISDTDFYALSADILKIEIS